MQFSEDRVQELLERMQRQSILMVGDIMLDRFVWGKVSRISPEAPVPVVHVTDESAFPGGAANVARNLSDFGIPVSLVGVIGADTAGNELLAALSDAGISTDGIVALQEHRTTVKTRVIARQQQVVRVDREPTEPMPVSYEARVLERCIQPASRATGLIIEDYGKGLVSQHVVDQLAKTASDRDIPVTADPAISNPIDWAGVTAVKPNRHETVFAAGPGSQPGEPDIEEAGMALLARWDLKMLLVTLGEEGMCLLRADDSTYHTPTRARDVYDVSGAGDTAIAFFTAALAAGSDGPEAAEVANHAAGLVVGKLGTATVKAHELAESMLTGVG